MTDIATKYAVAWHQASQRYKMRNLTGTSQLAPMMLNVLKSTSTLPKKYTLATTNSKTCMHVRLSNAPNVAHGDGRPLSSTMQNFMLEYSNMSFPLRKLCDPDEFGQLYSMRKDASSGLEGVSLVIGRADPETSMGTIIGHTKQFLKSLNQEQKGYVTTIHDPNNLIVAELEEFSPEFRDGYLHVHYGNKDNCDNLDFFQTESCDTCTRQICQYEPTNCFKGIPEQLANDVHLHVSIWQQTGKSSILQSRVYRQLQSNSKLLIKAITVKALSQFRSTFVYRLTLP